MLQAAEERTNESLRVLIVDDHDLFRTGLRNLLEEQGVTIVGEAAAGAEAVRIVREIAPDVVVMDLNMPGMGGIEATRHITAMAPLTRVVMLTISEDDSDVMDAILAGACGYLLKDSSIQDLMTGISRFGSYPTLCQSDRLHILGELRHWGIGAVVVGPMGNEAKMVEFFTDLFGSPPEEVGGVSLWSSIPSALPAGTC